jgi:hypothetical protein
VGLVAWVAMLDGKASDRFSCYKQGRFGPLRECSPSRQDACDQLGCFERATAFCFQVRYDHGEVSSICTPTARECEQWHEDRKTNFTSPPSSFCVEAGPDEYVGD